jgi:hypothetical protein
MEAEPATPDGPPPKIRASTTNQVDVATRWSQRTRRAADRFGPPSGRCPRPKSSCGSIRSVSSANGWRALSQTLMLGAKRLLEAVKLVTHPERLYDQASDHVRRPQLNQTFYEHFNIDESEVQGIHVPRGVLEAPFDGLGAAFSSGENVPQIAHNDSASGISAGAYRRLRALADFNSLVTASSEKELVARPRERRLVSCSPSFLDRYPLHGGPVTSSFFVSPPGDFDVPASLRLVRRLRPACGSEVRYPT